MGFGKANLLAEDAIHTVDGLGKLRNILGGTGLREWASSTTVRVHNPEYDKYFSFFADRIKCQWRVVSDWLQLLAQSVCACRMDCCDRKKQRGLARHPRLIIKFYFYFVLNHLQTWLLLYICYDFYSMYTRWWFSNSMHYSDLFCKVSGNLQFLHK